MKSKTLRFAVGVVLLAALATPVRMPAQTPTTRFRHYKLIDVGTFGGPNSYINGPDNSFPSVNSRGITVGPSATSVPAPANTNPFGCLGRDGEVPYIFHGFELQNGLVTDLGALSPEGQNCSDAQAVNARGEVVGVSENGLIDPVTGLIEDRAVRWENGEVHDLGTFGCPHSAAFGINNRGQSQFLFPSDRNPRGYQATFKTVWCKTLRRAKVPYFRIYDLRSTYATRLSAGGVADEWVTQMLRQGDAQVMKKYSQMKLQMKREALEKLNRSAGEAARAPAERMCTVVVQ